MCRMYQLDQLTITPRTYALHIPGHLWPGPGLLSTLLHVTSFDGLPPMVRDMPPCREFEVCNFVNIIRYRPFSVSDSSVNPDHLFSLTCRTKMTGVIAEGKHTASNTMILEFSPKTAESCYSLPCWRVKHLKKIFQVWN